MGQMLSTDAQVTTRKPDVHVLPGLVMILTSAQPIYMHSAAKLNESPSALVALPFAFSPTAATAVPFAKCLYHQILIPRLCELAICIFVYIYTETYICICILCMYMYIGPVSPPPYSILSSGPSCGEFNTEAHTPFRWAVKLRKKLCDHASDAQSDFKRQLWSIGTGTGSARDAANMSRSTGNCGRI